jgi:hypothetical protein
LKDFLFRNLFLKEIIETTEVLLEKEEFDRIEVTSPIKWICELYGIRELRLRVQAIGGGFVGL